MFPSLGASKTNAFVDQRTFQPTNYLAKTAKGEDATPEPEHRKRRVKIEMKANFHVSWALEQFFGRSGVGIENFCKGEEIPSGAFFALFLLFPTVMQFP